MIALLLACALSRSEPTGAVSFPHPDDYERGALHGSDSLSAGTGACLSCHREDSTAPTCASCHDDYPHPKGWLAGSTHGHGLTGDGGAAGRADCATCHGKDELKAPECASCHGSYPHPDGWALADHHGDEAQSRGTAACAGCHGADLGGTPEAPSCASCHASFPHPPGWSDPSVHGHADLGTCAACHGDLGTGGVSGVACSRCHADYPHPAGWDAGHLSAVERAGERSCLSCHEAGVGPTLPVACGAACHGGRP